MFTRRLQRALPIAFKWHSNKKLIENPEEQTQFTQNMKIFVPEDPLPFIEDSDWNIIDFNF